MLITPVFLAVLLNGKTPHSYFFAAFIFSIGAITDTLDGRIARKFNQITVFGKLMDPIADKMLTTAALLGFMQLGLCNIWIIVIVLAREFSITSLRLVASSQGTVIPANVWGKLKTVCQMIFTIAIMLLGEVKHLGWFGGLKELPLISNILLWITAALTAVSGIIYIYDSRRIIKFD